MKLINRKDELEFLERKFNSNNAELVIIYGRRRIGKTELLINFLEKHQGMYFLGRLESREDTIKRFNNLLIDSFNDLQIAKRNLVNWDEFFDYLGEKATKRLVLVIDEFPFLVDRFSEIVSVLQDKWDNLLSKTKLMIILCGSSVGMMEKYAIDYQSPLYGRRTGQWMVDKLNPKSLAEFFPGYNVQEQILVYGCLDMIPGYLVKFDNSVPVKENIKNKILSKGEFLYEEIVVLLREELRDPSNYLSILASIAGGAVRFHEVAAKTGLDKSLISKYLHVLDNLGIVKRIISVDKSYKAKLKTKSALYFIKDNFIDFWLRYVYLNKQQLERGDIDIVLDMIIKEMPGYMGNKFENYIKEILPDINIIQYSKSGKWWHKDKEIDIVALNDKNKQILFMECKWKDNVDAKKILAKLREKSEYVGWNKNNRKEYYAIFCKSFKQKIMEKNVFLFDLKGLEKFYLKKF